MNKLFEILEQIGSLIPAPLYWENVDSVILGANQHVLKGAGIQSLDEYVGKSLYQLYPKEMADNIKLHNEKVMKTGHVLSQEEKIVDITTGEVKYFTAVKAPLYDEKGRIIGIIGTSVDITGLKRTEADLRLAKEKAETANRVKSEFITNMSHDVRTPLSGVIGASDILEQEGDTEKDRELGHAIHTSAERLLQLLDDVLEVISADETCEANLKFHTFNLQSRFEFIEELLAPSAQIHNISLNFNIDKNVPQYIVSDRIKIDRILLNIISNALKFTHSGSINIHVKKLNMKKGVVTLEFNITDTGIGISEDQIDKIFDRFYRISPSFVNKYKGHGIGLFIVQKYVSLLKGTISVQSKLGEGTNFTVTLPAKIGKACEVEDLEEATIFVAKNVTDENQNKCVPLSLMSLTKKNDTQAGNVLVVEDDVVARKVVKSILSRAGFEVVDVETAELGLWEVMNTTYDFMLTDIGLPRMDGNQLTAMIRAWEKITHRPRLPIIGLSAHGSNQQAAAQAAGMDILFPKPLNNEKIKYINDHFLKIDEKALAQENSTQDNQPVGLGYDLPQTEEKLFELENYPLLNEEEGIAASGGSIEMLQELLTMLVKEVFPEELPLLKKAHDTSDWDSVQALAHKLKGGALYCGTIRLQYACQYTERYRLAGHSKLLEELYQQLLVVIDETVAFIKEWLKQKAAKLPI